MNGLAQLMVQPLLQKKMYIIYRKFCFVHVIFIANQATLEKTLSLLKVLLFLSL